MKKTMAAVSLEDFEGLVFKTAVMLMPFVEEDFDDVKQLLRIKVWKAYESFDPARSKLPLKRYVFGCLFNYAKDIKKRRHRALLFIEDIAPQVEGGQESHFYAQYLSVSEETAFFDAEDEAPVLPNTLSGLERRVIGLLLLDYNATEISRTLGIGPTRLRGVRDGIEAKMADWRPNVVQPQEQLLEAA